MKADKLFAMLVASLLSLRKPLSFFEMRRSAVVAVSVSAPVAATIFVSYGDSSPGLVAGSDFNITWCTSVKIAVVCSDP